MSLDASAGPLGSVSSIPVLTDVLESGPSPAIRHGEGYTPDLLGAPALDVAELERRLVQDITQRLQGVLEQRVHASVAPAVSLLADRIAYKAAQEVAADLAERMGDDLREAVRHALDEALRPPSRPFT